MIPIYAGAGTAFLLLVWIVGTLNRFVRLRNLIRESWADLDVALQRRHDLIPNLVETVKGYAAFEQQTLQRVIDARNQALGQAGTATAMFAGAETALTQALTGFFARVEAYPQLKSSEQFLSLQRELADTEDRIAAARRFYNANVRDYNIAIASFPASILRGGRSPAPYFEADDQTRIPPTVGFTE